MYPDIDSEKDQFSGKIFIYSLEGDFINGFRVKDGYFVSKFIKKNNTAKKSFGNNTYNSRTVGEGELNEVIIINSYHSPKNVITDLQLPNDWEIGGNAGSDYAMGWDYNSGGGGDSSTPSTEQAIEDEIDDSLIDPCTKAVLDKLKNLTQSDIAAMINRFNLAGSIFKINMSTGQVSNTNNLAETTKVTGSSTDVNIVFNEDYINGKNNSNPPTDLSVATTMTHEVIHAYLISLLEENKTCGASGICDFPTIYDAYVQQQISKDLSILPDAHHELIASHYVNAIASTIEEFHTGQSVDSGFPRQVYLDMAWED